MATTLWSQLAGAGTDVPSLRSTRGGGYGSVPASNPVGPEGGAVLRERTMELLQALRLMPDGLEGALTHQSRADLIAYLRLPK